ncbi:MAG: molecular chaperone TorD family protein [Desulfohalobiaceae bacterium]|nr:molecular chaperone TorD family protein [Desulfohalobiaceae bacterium]
MTDQDALPEQGNRLGELFFRLAAGYYQPDPELPGNLRELPELLRPLSSEMAAAAGQVLSELEDGDGQELLREYSRLFVGPFELGAPPFGSVYLESEGLMMGRSTVEVDRIYRETGLEMSPDFRSPPDHVAAELEFLAYLCFREGNSQDPQEAQFYRRRLGLFLQNHIGAWFPLFADKVEENASRDFYPGLSRLTRRLLEEQPLNLAGVTCSEA